MESHVFNEYNKTFQPISTICTCCNVGVAELDTNYTLKIYQENKRSEYVVFSTVSYGKIKIVLPRCKSCKNIHLFSDVFGFLIGISLGIAFAYICYQYIKNTFIGILVLIGFAAINVFAGEYLKKIIFKYKGIKSKEEIVSEDSFVAKFLNNGWTKTKPVA